MTTPEDFFALQPQWEGLQTRTRAPVSMSFTWISIWWKTFGARFSLRILAGWEGDCLVGIFPCFLETFSLGPLSATRLRFLGEYSVLAEYHPLVEGGQEEAFAVAAADFCLSLLRSHACDLIDFHAFPYDLPIMQKWIACMKGKGVVMHILERVVPRVRIELPKTVPEYFARLSSRERGQARRKERVLLAAGARYECITDPADSVAFRDAVRLSTRVWEQRGKASYYVSNEGFERFQHDVTHAMLQEGIARLYFLAHEGKRFASIQAFAFNGVMQAYLGGRDPEHALARRSPGIALLTYVISRAIEEGFAEYDFFTGDQEYKFQFGGTIHGWHGRVTAALKRPGGWKGLLMISAHKTSLAMGKYPRLRWVFRQFDQVSKKLRGVGSPQPPAGE